MKGTLSRATVLRLEGLLRDAHTYLAFHPYTANDTPSSTDTIVDLSGARIICFSIAHDKRVKALHPTSTFKLNAVRFLKAGRAVAGTIAVLGHSKHDISYIVFGGNVLASCA